MLPMFKLREKTMGCMWGRVHISSKKGPNKQGVRFPIRVQFPILDDFLQLCQFSLWVHENFTKLREKTMGLSLRLSSYLLKIKVLKFWFSNPYQPLWPQLSSISVAGKSDVLNDLLPRVRNPLPDYTSLREIELLDNMQTAVTEGSDAGTVRRLVDPLRGAGNGSPFGEEGCRTCSVNSPPCASI